jgi:outer membrane protein
MKKTFLIASALIISIGFLFTQTSCNNKQSSSQPVVNSNANGAKTTSIAYVDIDSFEANYSYLKEQREKFQAKQAAMEAELQRSAQQLQANAQSADQKARSGNMSEAEMVATQKKLAQMQQSLEIRQQSLTQQLLKEKDEFNTKLHDELDSFLKEYNADKKYDFILSYSSLGGSQILLANPAFDITKDVIKGMNERAKKIKPNDEDTTKKK